MVLFLIVFAAPGRAASVAIQAESGTLGSQIAIGTNGTTRYITTTVNGAGTNPGSTARVATWTVTFPAAGAYNLFGRVMVGSGGANDDSFFYGNGFGTKSTTTDADWILVNSINVGGYTNANDVVTNSGTAGISVWKWINFSQYTGTAGETPVTFTVSAGNLTQTFQIGTREDGLFIDALVFGTSSNFTVANLDAAVALPNSPTSLSARGGNAVVNLTWVQSTSPNITQNKVYRSTSGSGGPYSLLNTLAATTSYGDTAVVNGTQYFYTVTALNVNGESAFSAFSGATPAATPPAAPTGLTATAGNGQVSLSWAASTGATSYNVKRATTSGGPYTTVTNVIGTSVVNTGLANGTTYFYVVSALNSGGESANSSQVSATPSSGTPPVPIGLTATAGNAQVSLSWTASSGATSYNVKRSTTSGGPYTTVTNVTGTSVVNTGLANGTAYFFVVSALNANGESANSSQVSATPSGPPPGIPLVYSVENTGTNCGAPPMPGLGSLPLVQPFPDPFMWVSSYMNGTFNSRSTNFSDWECHRNEIRAMILNYEIGARPTVASSQVTASYSGGTTPGSTGTLTVQVTVNGKTLTLTSAVSIPSGAVAPYPFVIGMNSPNGSLPASDFSSRGIATVVYTHNQVTTYGNPQNTDPFFQLYPSQNVDNTGQYAAWSWGVSRIIDGLQKVAGTLHVDMNHICVTGCSYAGKMALYSGAFDERVALTVAQESGGGGDTSWRYSQTEPNGTVEKIDNTDYRWFENSMVQFAATNVSFLPEDHHMLMVMCAPRALYCTANTDFTWLSNPSAYVCGQACAKTYAAIGIGDRFGFNVDGGHNHCTFPSDQEGDLGYFLNKFMKGQTNLSQSIRTAPSSYSSINYTRWTAWWGTTTPVFGP